MVTQLKLLNRKVNHPNLSSFLNIHFVDQGMAIMSPLVRRRNLHDHIFSDVPSKASIEFECFTFNGMFTFNCSLPSLTNFDTDSYLSSYIISALADPPWHIYM